MFFSIALLVLFAIKSLPGFSQKRQPKPAPSNPNTALVDKLVDTDKGRLLEIFKDIHANPELGFMETHTAAIAEKELKALGCKTISGIGVTGIYRTEKI